LICPLFLFQEFFFSNNFNLGRSKLSQYILSKSKIFSQEENKFNEKTIKKLKSGRKFCESIEQNDEEDVEQLLAKKRCLILKDLDEGKHHAITEKGGEIGREKNCEIQIHDRQVSKFNSKLIFSEGSYYLSDKRSFNGTYVKFDQNMNKIRIMPKMLIKIVNFHIKVVEISMMSISIEIIQMQEDEVVGKDNEKITFFEDKIACLTIDEGHPRGYILFYKEKKDGMFDIEFKSIKENKYICLSQNPTNEYYYYINNFILGEKINYFNEK